MIFVTVMTVEPQENREVYEAIKKIEVPDGVKLVSALGLFGEYDAMLVYEAPDEKVAMDFLLDLCKIDGVVDTKTFAATKLR